MITAYVDADDFKESLSIATGDTYADNDIDRAIIAASGGIDQALGRTFARGEADDDIRLYSPNGARLDGVLFIDDLIDLATVRVDTSGGGSYDTWVEDEHFRLEPLNAVIDEEPWTSVRTLSGQRFPSHPLAIVEVTGRFGWEAPPTQIVQAAGMIAKQLLIRDRQAPFGIVTAGSDVGAVAYIARRDPHINALISPFSRRAIVSSPQLR